MTNSPPLVSICIPVYNTVKFVEETVQCFLDQTYKNLEIIIQDDCSTDGTWELLKDKFSLNSRIQLFRNDLNLGIGENWNRCFSHCSGQYVVIANADDFFTESFVEIGLDILIREKCKAVTFYYERFLERDSTVNSNFANFPSRSGQIVDQVETIYFNNPFSIVFTIFETAILKEIENCRERLFLPTQVCDFEVMLQVAFRSKIYFCSELAGRYRIHLTNNSLKPLGEIRSFFFDVLPVLRNDLKTAIGRKYKYKARKMLIGYLKLLLQFKTPLDVKLIVQMVILSL